MGGDSLDDAIQVSFMDTPKLIAGGFGMVSMGMAALANAVRSPSSDRDPGLIMPSFAKLTDGAKACVYVARLNGDDLMMTGQSDRSVLVNACGAVGMLGGATTPIVIGAIAGGMAGSLMPALGKARSNAKELKSATQLRQISMAMMIWEQEHDALPESIEAMVKGQFLTPEIFNSPLGPVFDAEGDYWINMEFQNSSDIESPDRLVLGYDRAMAAQGRKVAVVFFDGHVETVSIDDFMDLIADDPNSDFDFNLPGDIDD
jgi:prepilin-type processing-associated H-X9-DG protein